MSSTHPDPTPRRIAAIAAAVIGWIAGQAQAETSPYSIGASELLGHETNLLRVRSDLPLPDGYSRPDSYSVTSLQAALDQPFGRQRAYANGVFRATRYRNNDLYNNDGYSANAGLQWSTIERISGTLTGAAYRNLTSFTDSAANQVRQKNLEDTQTVDASASIGLVTEYSLEVGAGHRRVRNSVKEGDFLSRNYSQNSAYTALRWRPSAISNFGIGASGVKGRYPNGLLDVVDGQAVYTTQNFTRRDIDLSAGWQPSGASAVDARISFGRTSYDQADQRNFSGFTGTIGWDWTASGKLRFNTRLTRDNGKDITPTTIGFARAVSDYSRVSNSLRLQADYSVTAKIGLTGSFQWLDRSLRQSVVIGSFDLPQSDHERTLSLALGSRWSPTRSVLVGCDLGSDKRSANGVLSSPYRDTAFSCYGQLTLN